MTLYSPFIFVQLTSLCLDTVTLKKNTLYNVGDVKKKRRKKKADLIQFAFLYMCFVPKGFVYLCVEFCARCHMFFWEKLSLFLQRTQRYCRVAVDL